MKAKQNSIRWFFWLNYTKIYTQYENLGVVNYLGL